MSKTITITKTIPAPPEGWEWQDRHPKVGEEAIAFTLGMWTMSQKAESWGWASKNCELAFAYRIRDEYAERYEALKLPDGWAWTSEKYDEKHVMWTKNRQAVDGYCIELRRIVNGKAVKP